MSATGYLETVEKCYIAYYGRAADTEGAAFWANELDEANGNLSEIIDAFANSAEAEAMYGNKTVEQKINAIYNQLFDRDADEGGLAYYSDALASHKLSHGSIALDILNGAQQSDMSIIQERVSSAVEQIDMGQFNAFVGSSSHEIIPDNLMGEYQLIDFDVYYLNGTHLDGDDVTFSGEMNIYDSYFTQDVTTNGQEFHAAQCFTFIGENTIQTSVNGVDYTMNYSVNDDVLTTFFNATTIGGNFAEHDYWEYVGS